MKFLLGRPLFSVVYECKKGVEIGLPICVLCHLAKSSTSIALVLLVGFLALQEPLTGARALAIVLIAAGIFLLQTQGG
jgi:hypothetical protein